jgi:hypothetical protein
MRHSLTTTALTKIAAAALLTGVAIAAQATVLPYKDYRQLAAEADGIVLGTVRQVQSVAAGPGDINTFVTIEPQEVISGQLAQRSLTLKLVGGFDGQRGVHVDGTPSFAAGERVLVFVQGNGIDLVPFVGWSQGVFRVVRDAAGDVDRVVDADGTRVLDVRGNHVLRDEAAHGAVDVLGAPPQVAMARSALPEASAGLSDDGSAVTDTQVRKAVLPAMTLERFLAPLRSAAPSGRALRSVAPADVQPAPAALTAERSAQPVQDVDYPVARPGNGSVTEPLARPVQGAARTGPR